MAIQRTLLDGDTGGKFSSLELLVGEVEGGTLPAGDYAAEPLVWNGTAWVGGDEIEVNTIRGHARPPSGAQTLNLVAGSGGHISADAPAGIELTSGDNAVLINPVGDAITDEVGGAIAFQRRFNGGAVQLRFFDNGTPSPRPVITGVLTQDQVDSLVSALVALGLVTDGR